MTREYFNLVLHRVPRHPLGTSEQGQPLSSVQVLMVEVEPSTINTVDELERVQREGRVWLAKLGNTEDIDALCDMGVRGVRDITGYQRVMLYRFDDQGNGHVLAEDRDPDLPSWLGLAYPESDIPVQARQLYTRSLMRIVSDSSASAVDIVVDPSILGDSSLDLTESTLRSNSPSHIQYLTNMGVTSCMSISLMRENELWGLMIGHNYNGPMMLDVTQGSIAQFFCSVMSIRMMHEEEKVLNEQRLLTKENVSDFAVALHSETQSIADIVRGSHGIRRLIDCDEIFIDLAHDPKPRDPEGSAQLGELLRDWVAKQPQEVAVTSALPTAAGVSLEHLAGICGVLSVQLPQGQSVAWLRREYPQVIRWGGDPDKLDISYDAQGNLTFVQPRKDFEPFEEKILGKAKLWTTEERLIAEQVRALLVEQLLARSQREISTAQTIRQALLPTTLPQPEGWTIQAVSHPAPGGLLGGDWYDVVRLQDGSYGVSMGDVAGHGLDTTGAMAHLRGALHAYISEGLSPAHALAKLDAMLAWEMPRTIATAIVARIYPQDGLVEIARAGHPIPLLLTATTDSTTGLPSLKCRELDLPSSMMLGLESPPPPMKTLHLKSAESLIVFTDGLVESRGEAFDVGVQLLSRSVESGTTDLAQIVDQVRNVNSTDDATIVVISRHV